MSAFLHHTACPACGGDDDLAVYDNGTAYCFGCGKNYSDWEMEEGDSSPPLPKRTDFLPVEIKPLTKRGITFETCKAYGYGYSWFYSKRGESRVHVAPYFIKGELVAQHLRFITKDFIWLGNSHDVEFFGQHLWPETGDQLIITEGEIDCLTIAQALNFSCATVSLPSGAKSAQSVITQQLNLLEGYSRIILCFDNDIAGHRATQIATALLSPGKVWVPTLPMKDPNAMLLSGRETELIQCVNNAQPFYWTAWEEFNAKK